jgi:hypothetical protein
VKQAKQYVTASRPKKLLTFSELRERFKQQN